MKDGDRIEPGLILDLAYYGVLCLISIVGPLIILQLDLPIVNRESVLEDRFRVFAFLSSLSIVMITWREYKKRKDLGFQALFPLILGALLAFHFIAVYREFYLKAWDYICYERGIKAVILGENPYGDCYIYPPMFVQVMAWIFRMLYETGFLIDGNRENPALISDVILYLYQCSQLPATVIAYALTYKFARRIGVAATPAALLSAAMFLLSNPVIRNLRHNQVNLWILDMILVAFLLLDSYPIVAGMVLSVGIHLKIYPLILLAPLFLIGRFRIILGAVAGFAAILVVQTDFLTDFTLWFQFYEWSFPFSKSYYFIDNSIHSIIYNSVKLTGLVDHMEKKDLMVLVDKLVIPPRLVIIGWMGWRFIRREKAYRKYSRDAADGGMAYRVEQCRVFGHLTDAIALSLLFSPIVWPHHYLIAVPLALWAIVVRGPDRPWLVAISVFLMFGPPTFGVFPFSYYQITGLVMTLILLAPARSFENYANLRHKDLFNKVFGKTVMETDETGD